MLSAALHRISALQPRFIAPMSTSRILAIRAIEVKTHTYGIITSSQNTYINHFRIHTRFNRCTSEIHMYQLQSIRRLSVLRHHRIKDTSGVGFDNPIECLRVDNTGKVSTVTCTKENLIDDLQLQLRDVRILQHHILDPTQIRGTFSIKYKTIVFCIENIKAIVRDDHILLFHPEELDVQDLVSALSTQMNTNNPPIYTTTTTSSNNSTTPPPPPPFYSSSILFEHIAIEAALNVICSTLYNRVKKTSVAITPTLVALQNGAQGLDDVVMTQVDQLLPLKNEIDELRKRVKEVKRVLNEVLQSNDDILAMNTLHEQHLDMILKNSVNEIEWISSEIEEIIDEVINTEEHVNLQTDLLRNRILQFELVLAMATFVATLGALIAGIFGMNLVNHMESQQYFFYVLSFAIFGGMLAMFRVLLKITKKLL